MPDAVGHVAAPVAGDTHYGQLIAQPFYKPQGIGGGFNKAFPPSCTLALKRGLKMDGTLPGAGQ